MILDELIRMSILLGRISLQGAFDDGGNERIIAYPVAFCKAA